jgi:hypothetical protein
MDEDGMDYAEVADLWLDPDSSGLWPKSNYVNVFEGGSLCLKN